MTWFNVDGARRYLRGESPHADERLDPKKKPTRKVVYRMVEDGMRVARSGEGQQPRLIFSPEWIDEYLTARSQEKQNAAPVRRDTALESERRSDRSTAPLASSATLRASPPDVRSCAQESEQANGDLRMLPR